MKFNYTTLYEVFGIKSRNPFTSQPTLTSAPKKEALKSQTQFNYNVIKRERLYTKLKYSRCPQYDIVSGGFAALLSAFIGFLISEKFGIELVDSGDFYIAFMYGVFLTFSTKPLLRVTSKSDPNCAPWASSIVLNFSYSISTLLIQHVSNFVTKLLKLLK